jgi:hypothetical protein
MDEYAAGLPPAQAEVLAVLRRLVRETAPELTETVKWGQPVWEHGGPVCWAKGHTRYVNFGFWRGADLADPAGILVGDGERMRHVSLATAAAVPADVLAALVQDAIRLNATLGDPTKRAKK